MDKKEKDLKKPKKINKSEKDIKDALKEEAVQTPLRGIVNNFVSNKLTMLAVVTFVLVIVLTFTLSAIYPLDVNFSDSTQQNIPPSSNLMAYPNSIEGSENSISVGSSFSVSIDTKGNPVLWGQANKKLKKLPSNASNLTMISAGLNHVVALNEMNQIITWGSSDFGLDRVPEISPRHGKVVFVEAGYQYSVAVTDKGFMYLWGNSNFVNVETALIPQDMQGHIVKVGLSTTNVIVLLDDGNVRVLGSQATPFTQMPEGVANVIDIAVTETSVAAITSDKKIYTWGQARYGELAYPEMLDGHVISVTAGSYHFVALTDNHQVVAWGRNNLNQLSIPKSLDSQEVQAIYSGYYQNYAIKKDGKIVTWGLKGYRMGSDDFGRDVFRRLVEGGRISLTVGLVALVVASLIGISLGAVAGFYGGRIDNLIMRFGEIIGIIPILPIILILSVVIGNRLEQNTKMVLVMSIIGLLNWPGTMRLIRGAILTEREKEFVLSARAMGIKEKNIVIRHILPNVITLIIIQITLGYASYLLYETTLSFLGFGVLDPKPSWGNMLTSSANALVLANYWWRWVFPALAVSITSISVNLIGDGLRNAVDPKSNER